MKITHNTKNQEDLKLNEKRQSIDANTEMTEILELFDKDFKADMIKIFQQWHSWNIWKIESLKKEIEDIKENQGQILELKNTITKCNNQKYKN